MSDEMLDWINAITNVAQLIILTYLAFLVIPKFHQKGGCGDGLGKDGRAKPV